MLDAICTREKGVYLGRKCAKECKKCAKSALYESLVGRIASPNYPEATTRLVYESHLLFHREHHAGIGRPSAVATEMSCVYLLHYGVQPPHPE